MTIICKYPVIVAAGQASLFPAVFLTPAFIC